MDKRKELKLAYKQGNRPMGVYQIKNEANGKVLVGSSPNLDGIKNRFSFQMKYGVNLTKELQQDLAEFGIDSFSFEVLERLEPEEDGTGASQDDLAKLEEKWLEKLQPYGEKGYNKKKHN